MKKKGSQCSCCCGDKSQQQFMYRKKNGVDVFTGFSLFPGGTIVWVGKDEKLHRPIVTEADQAFFLREMKQYDP